jgi:hypothetical protein
VGVPDGQAGEQGGLGVPARLKLRHEKSQQPFGQLTTISSFRPKTRHRCYDFKNIFAEKLAFFVQTTRY